MRKKIWNMNEDDDNNNKQLLITLTTTKTRSKPRNFHFCSHFCSLEVAWLYHKLVSAIFYYFPITLTRTYTLDPDQRYLVCNYLLHDCHYPYHQKSSLLSPPTNCISFILLIIAATIVIIWNHHLWASTPSYEIMWKHRHYHHHHLKNHHHCGPIRHAHHWSYLYIFFFSLVITHMACIALACSLWVVPRCQAGLNCSLGSVVLWVSLTPFSVFL